MDDGVINTLLYGPIIVGAWVDGDKIGFSVRGSDLSAWQQSGTGPWVRIGTVFDNTYTNAGRLALEIVDVGLSPQTVIDDFGGGDPFSRPFTSHAWNNPVRVVHAHASVTQSFGPDALAAGTPAPPNQHRLFIDLDNGHLIWRLTGGP